MPCNRFECPSTTAVWAVGPWSTCDYPVSPCVEGVSTRSVSCMLSTSGAPQSPELCHGASPSNRSACVPEATQCACSPAAPCSSPFAECVEGACVCTTGWLAPSCTVPALAPATGQACSGLVDTAGACCGSAGIVDAVTGLCCPPNAVLDKQGRCCAGAVLDACGVCNGTGLAVDALGLCCSSSVAASGLCCSNAVVDSCGVCGGADECPAAVQTAVAVTAGTSLTSPAFVSAVADSLSSALQRPVTNVSVASVARRARQLTSSSIQATVSFTVVGVADAAIAVRLSGAAAATATSPSSPFRLTGSVDLQRVPECGNGRCEDGEVCQDAVCSRGCLADCPIVPRACPAGPGGLPCSGRGDCVSSTGSCTCFVGYTGPACDGCSSGFAASSAAPPSSNASTVLCTRQPGAICLTCGPSQDCPGACAAARAALQSPVPSGGASSSGSLSKLLPVLVGGTVAAVAVVGLALFGVWAWKRSRRPAGDAAAGPVVQEWRAVSPGADQVSFWKEPPQSRRDSAIAARRLSKVSCCAWWGGCW
jgi:hypothetical protein